jgi:hypothetical protein
MPQTHIATTFLSHFPDIQMRLHPDRIPDTEARVVQRVITDKSEIAPLFTAFRATRHQAVVPFKTPFAYPMRIRELVERFAETKPSFRASFEAMRLSLMATPGAIDIEIPAYDLGSGDLLLLDGNHRATALYLGDRPFTLRITTLSAPVDRRYLITLKHWDGGLRRFPLRIRRRLQALRTAPR